MLKKSLRDEQMSSVDLAITYARKLVNAEARGPGDIENAMDRLEARTGIGRWTIWALWHRRRKVIDGDLIGKLQGAYYAHCEGQIARLQHELAVDAARSGNASDEDLLAEAEALVAKIKARRRA